MKDPYLIPGQVCRCFYDSGKEILMYFNGYVGELPVFVNDIEFAGRVLGGEPAGDCFKNYHPLGTEWDRAPAWALDPKNKGVCSTVDRFGRLAIWLYSELKVYDFLGHWYHPKIDDSTISLTCGICPDKTRYQGDAWKTSLRMRPDWAK